MPSDQQQMRPDKHTEYFPAEHRQQKISRPTKRSSHQNILEQFERKSPTPAHQQPVKEKSPLRPPRMQSPPHSINGNSHSRLPPTRKTRPQRNQSNSREYNAEYTGIIRMSDSLERNRVELTLQRTIRKNLRLDFVSRGDNPNYRSQTHSHRISTGRRYNKSRDQSDHSLRELKTSKQYTSALGKTQVYGYSSPTAHHQIVTMMSNQDETSNFRKVLMWYVQQIDQFVRLAQLTTPTKDSKLDTGWVYHFYCTLRSKFEKLLLRLRQTCRMKAGHATKHPNITVLQQFHARVQSENGRIMESYGKMAVGQIKRSALRQNQQSRRELTQMLAEQVAMINSQLTLSPQAKHRLDMLQQCLKVVDYLRTSYFLPYFQQQFLTA